MILLDTHVWIWWLADPESLSAAARAALDEAVEEGGVAVSCISVWEMALLVAKGRLAMTMEPGRWLEMCESLPFLSFLPIDQRIALGSVALPPSLHADPADRMIVATALLRGLRLISKDERLRESGLASVVW